MVVTFSAHTDRVYTKELNISYNFNLKDEVVYIPNGLIYKVENNKQLKWMTESKLYGKIISNNGKNT